MYNFKDGDTILFQGDSITDGNRGRSDDPNHIHGHGYQYILASEIYSDNLDKNITVINRGVSGNRISDLYDRWEEDCIKLNPTLVSILIGINDVLSRFENIGGSDPQRFEELYRNLLDGVLENNPDTVIVIMEPFYGRSRSLDFYYFCKRNVPIYAEITKRIALEYNAVFVPLQDIFDRFIETPDIFKVIWDGVHPTTGGHGLIAKRWKKCVENKLNTE